MEVENSSDVFDLICTMKSNFILRLDNENLCVFSGCATSKKTERISYSTSSGQCVYRTELTWSVCSGSCSAQAAMDQQSMLNNPLYKHNNCQCCQPKEILELEAEFDCGEFLT